MELHAAMNLNLVEMHSGKSEGPRSLEGTLGETEFVEWFELTDLGREALKAAEKTQ